MSDHERCVHEAIRQALIHQERELLKAMFSDLGKQMMTGVATGIAFEVDNSEVIVVEGKARVIDSGPQRFRAVNEPSATSMKSCLMCLR